MLPAERAKALRAGLDPSIKAVGVFVNLGTDEAAGIIRTASLDIAQLHGDETDEDICRLRQECPMLAQVWKAVRIKDGFNIGGLNQYSSADRLVLDAYVEGYGGAGKSFDLNLIKGVDPKANYSGRRAEPPKHQRGNKRGAPFGELT